MTLKQTEIDNFLTIKTPDGRDVKELTTAEFCRFFLSKLTEVPAYDKDIMFLTNSLQRWSQETMSEETKIDIIRQFIKLGLL